MFGILNLNNIGEGSTHTAKKGAVVNFAYTLSNGRPWTSQVLFSCFEVRDSDVLIGKTLPPVWWPITMESNGIQFPFGCAPFTMSSHIAPSAQQVQSIPSKLANRAWLSQQKEDFHIVFKTQF